MPAGAASDRLPFMKMHGLGNDFVVIDLRGGVQAPSVEAIRRIGDRHFGVGFDQLALISNDAEAAASLVFYNPDGSISAACGNATRCIARHLMDESGLSTLSLRTERGILQCEAVCADLVRVNMGLPQLDWIDVPLSEAMDTLHLPIEGDPVATGMGNPHCTFFVDSVEGVDLKSFGSRHEHHPLFPRRTNVEIVEVRSPSQIRLRIWERGTGITLASGSCSRAAAVAAARRGLTDRKGVVLVDGGRLEIDWRDDGGWMTGPTAHVFDGVFTSEFLDGN